MPGYPIRYGANSVEKSLRTTAETPARSTLARGPASATHRSAFEGFLKFTGFMGTGFAQPNIPDKKRASVPMGSRCLSGFMVTLPRCFAVGSPSLMAVHAWAHSWMVRARSTGGAIRIILCI